MMVYLITNLINQKRYVGITTRTLNQRFKQHCVFKPSRKTKKSAIAEAIQLHGKENFKIEQIDIAATIEELYEKEKYWIEKLDTYGKEYNITKGGEGTHGKSHSTETIEKLKKAASKRMQDSKVRKHLSEKTKQYFIDHPEEKEKRRISQKNYTPSEETLQKISKANKGKKHNMSEEGRLSISIAQKTRIRKPISEATRQKFRDRMLKNNPMNDPEKRKLVGKSKIGKKIIIMEDGSRKYSI